jgi:hypothetical protein
MAEGQDARAVMRIHGAAATALQVFGFAVILTAWPALAATPDDSGKSVPTQTIIVPADPSNPQLPAGETPPANPPASPGQPAANEAVPVVEYDFSKLPVPVGRLRDQLMEAAATGDPEKLRPIIDANPDVQLSFDEVDDPIAFLKSSSGDEGGREILAVLIEVLEAGYVHVDAGTPDEMYVWPYFARYPVDKLSPQQLVELFKLVYAGDYEDMKAYGSYIYYRLGITPDGSWKYFLSGD